MSGFSCWRLGQRHREIRVPLGRVAIIATWNYPVQLLGVQLAQALVAGNSVVVKPSERAPRTQGRLLDLAYEAGMDAGRLSRVSHEREAGANLLTKDDFDHVVFTGSTEVGRSIAVTLAEKLTPSTLELSGSDSALVLADADPGLSARSILFALRLNSGRTCMAPRRVLADRAVLPDLLEAMRRELRVEREDASLRAEERQRAEEVALEAVDAGGVWLRDPEIGHPWVVTECPIDSALWRGEHFGPAMAVSGVDSLDEMLALHNAVPRRLATSVFTRGTALGRRLADRLGSSVVTVNDCVIPTGHPGAGLGGVGESGWGVSRGRAGLLAMTRPVWVSTTNSRLRTPLSPPSDRVLRGMRTLIRRLYS